MIELKRTTASNGSAHAADIRGTILADELSIGRGVVVEEGAFIGGKTGAARKVVLGDFCYVGRDVQVRVPEFRLGDYSKLHAGSFCHGIKPMQIGRNCWIGGNVVLDSIGGLDIDDNVGIGSGSQVWTHIQFGDIVEGSRFHSAKYMHIGKDAWFVGHTLVSPVFVGARSMAMLGSVIARDMLPNRVYAGVPAVDVTAKVGAQFEARTVEQKAATLREIIAEFEADHPYWRGELLVVEDEDEIDPERTCFDVSRRVYTQHYHAAEVAFLRAKTPLVKFTPDGAKAFVVPQQPVIPPVELVV